jgi:hypothetical protein
MNMRTKAGSALGTMALAAAAAMACTPAAGPTPKGPEAQTQPSAGEPAAAQVAAAKRNAPPPATTMEECRAIAKRPRTGHSGKSVGPNDPQRQFDDMFDAQHETFRCCFDMLFAPEAPRRDGHVALRVKVNHEGTLVSSEIVTAESNVQLPEVHACVLDIARQMAYPKPQNDQDVAYERVFDFKARR